MKAGPLYDEAVQLNARAARIAACLLAGDPAIPPELRRALDMALAKVDQAGGPAFAWDPGEPDARRALHFVQRCRQVCEAG